MLTIEKVMKRFNPFAFNLSYSDYLVAINGFDPPSSVDKWQAGLYSKILKRFLEFRASEFNVGDCYILLSQLLLGCRFSETLTIKWALAKNLLGVNVRCLKGKNTRNLLFPSHLPVVHDYVTLLGQDCTKPSYAAYCRSLVKSNPNFYRIISGSHLTVSHLARHFYVQSLYYVLCYSEKAVQERMCWESDETIDSYIDRDIWSKLNLGEFNDRSNNDSSKKRKHSGTNSGGSVRGSVGDRKVKKRKKKII